MVKEVWHDNIDSDNIPYETAEEYYNTEYINDRDVTAYNDINHSSFLTKVQLEDIHNIIYMKEELIDYLENNVNNNEYIDTAIQKLEEAGFWADKGIKNG